MIGREQYGELRVEHDRRNFAVEAQQELRDSLVYEAQRQLVADLGLLELRVEAGAERDRRGHDMRRTFISLARTDGALDGPLRWVTHGPDAKSMIDLYSTFTWATLCAEVVKLKISLREGTVVELREATPARWLKTSEAHAARASSTAWPTTGQRTRAVHGNHNEVAVIAALNVATPTGFEPVLPA
ncbi:hypothetical protein BH11MYX1_BH11MYX1_53300 [soil metagenome]